VFDGLHASNASSLILYTGSEQSFCQSRFLLISSTAASQNCCGIQNIRN
jgi:hypothetical protein